MVNEINGNKEEQQMQKLYMEYQMLDQQIKQMEKQLQVVETQVIDLQGIVINLDEFKSSKKEAEILFQIAPGLFSKAKLKDSNELIVNVGSGVAITKNIEQAKELLNKQLREFQQFRVQLSKDIRSLVMKAAEIEQELGMLK